MTQHRSFTEVEQVEIRRMRLLDRARISEIARRFSVGRERMRCELDAIGVPRFRVATVQPQPIRLDTPEVEELYRLRVHERLSIAQICQRLHRCNDWIRPRLDALGVPRVIGLNGGAGGYGPRDLAPIADLYRQGGMTWQQIADSLGLSKNTVAGAIWRARRRGELPGPKAKPMPSEFLDLVERISTTGCRWILHEEPTLRPDLYCGAACAMGRDRAGNPVRLSFCAEHAARCYVPTSALTVKEPRAA